MITVEYDFSFQADALYFGSVSQAGSAQLDHNQHRGGLHRLVIDDGVWDELDPANWKLNTMFYTGQPVTAAPAVAFDGKRAWVYFGTGRFLDAASDKKMFTRQSFYGLKEIYNDTDGMELSWGYDDGTRAKANLVDVTDVQVTDQTGNFTLVNPTLKDTNDVDVVSGMDDVTTFRLLNTAMSSKDGDDLDVYNGWKINFGESTSLFKGERNIGQAAILGDIVTFTSYVPSVDKCDTEGESYLWAPHYRTGTAFYRSIIGLDTDGTTVLRKLSLGKGLATTPNIHTGAEAGSKAFVQTSTGAIIGLEQTNPGVIKSGIISWRELNNE
jgi:type IV pilus assembly protein PilY1